MSTGATLSHGMKYLNPVSNNFTSSYIMVLDKFGRHRDKTQVPGRGPKGDGFVLTSEGDYDIQRKRLKFVKEPLDPEDAVNFSTLNNLKANVLLVGRARISAKGKRIGNLGKPVIADDAVTKGYVDSVVPLKNSQTNSYSFHQYNIKDLAYPKNDGDGVNLKFVKDNCLVYNKEIDAKGKKITNLESPVNPNDAVTLNYLTANALCKNKNVFDGQKSIISNVAVPVNVDDAVSKRYLKEVLGDLGFAIYKRLHSGRSALPKEIDWKSNVLTLSWSDLFNK